MKRPQMTFTGYTPLRSLYNRDGHVRSIYKYETAAFCLVLKWYPSFTLTRWLSTQAESSQSEFAGPNAYELLGISETSSFEEIKASFYKLAKETHPDVAQSCDFSADSQRFVQILAAYQILSDCEKRLYYDHYLLSQRRVIEKHPMQDYVMYKNESKQMEVVEWLEWYREAIKDIISENRVVNGSGYFDVLERDFYSAIHSAYYGPDIEPTNLLPECFEAEERSEYRISELLHLVSGRELFGMVCVSDKLAQLSHGYNERLTDSSQIKASQSQDETSDVYKDLEVHILGKRVAIATRVLDSEDKINIYLTCSLANQENPDRRFLGFANGSRFHLGTITGLGTSSEEGSCSVYNNNGVKTHEILKHRTLLVKHMHWYQVLEKVSVCECRCTRAKLPPSKFWLFEPRCGTHDIGGWYVETFGKDKKGRTVQSQRFWDGIHTYEQCDKRLHPAIYLVGLAYRSLDIEDARRRKKVIIKDIFGGKINKILSWCKKLV